MLCQFDQLPSPAAFVPVQTPAIDPSLSFGKCRRQKLGGQRPEQEIFKFRQTGVGEDGKAAGVFEACGIRPRLLSKLEAEGIKMPPDIFQYHVLSSTHTTE